MAAITMKDLQDRKLEKGGYTGTAQDLANRVSLAVPYDNYKGVYSSSTSYKDGDVVSMDGHETCYVIEVTISENSDPVLPKMFRKIYRITDRMFYCRQNGSWEILFPYEEKIDFYTIPQKGTTQQYQSTVDNFYPYSKMKRVVMNGLNGTTEKYELHNADSTKQISGTSAKLDGTDGNVMVRLPKFYSEVKFTPQGKRYRLYTYENPSKKIALGIKPNPLFEKVSGGYFDKCYISAYEGSQQGSQLISRSGVAPKVSITQAAFRDLCRQGRNTNWNILTYYQVCALQFLFIIEFGELNAQKLLGQGRANTSSASSTGTTNALGNRSGRISTDDGNGNISYRGIEDWYANVWDFVDGLMLSNAGYHITNDPSKFGNMSAMVNIKKTLSLNNTNGYVTAMEKLDGYEFTNIPCALGGNDQTYYCDYFWAHDKNEQNIALFGGGWGNGTWCGAFSLVCDRVASGTWSAGGSRLSIMV